MFVCRLRNVSNLKKLNIVIIKRQSIFTSLERVLCNIQKVLLFKLLTCFSGLRRLLKWLWHD
jgi:hypothetical protein